MNTRYRITRDIDGNQPEKAMTIEECKQFFASQDDFIYSDQHQVRSTDTIMTIPGHFFMWHIGEATIPFRFYEGDLYVAVSHEIIFQKMVDIAEQLHAQFIEG